MAMNELERQLQYPLGETLPDPGRALEVAPGVRWVRMGLPFALDHINLWLLRDRLDGREGWTLVDCGIANADTQGHWDRVFANELDGLPVLRLVVTHMHPDHIGLADWLTERWSEPGHPCRLWMSATDYTSARQASQSTTGFGGAAAAAFMASHGLTDPDALEKIKARTHYYASMVPKVPASYRRLLDGQSFDVGGHAWRCIAGYGHAPEHLSLHSESLGVLISGDMLLPRISTNVSVTDMEPEANSLTLYLQSIERYRTLPADTLVLPSHGRPFRGMHRRVDQLHQHHDERLADVMTACREAPQTAAGLLPVLFKRPLDLHQTTFAMGESIAHLHALWLGGQLQRTRGDDGVFRFSAA
jgi:glyoxylase-like metal-dependent hydrolase (beta-lactamase superfamily II)